MNAAEATSGQVAIALGDAGGIGPEVALKAVAAEMETDQTRYLFIGDGSLLAALNSRLGLKLPLEPLGATARGDRLLWYNPLSQPLAPELPVGSAQTARAALAWLREGAELCLRGAAD